MKPKTLHPRKKGLKIMEKFDIEFAKYEIMLLGFSENEVNILISAYNGIGDSFDDLCPLGESMAADLLFEARAVVEVARDPHIYDHLADDQDPKLLFDGLTNRAEDLARLANKVLDLEPWKAAAVRYFIYGFWSGMRQLAE